MVSVSALVVLSIANPETLERALWPSSKGSLSPPTAVEHGASIFKIMDVTRHKSVDVLRGYVRRADSFKDHAGAGFL